MGTLIIGNKNYSSWSLRPWLLLKEKEIDFIEKRIPLYVEGSRDQLLQLSPSGKVPAYIDDGITLWDSLAICEYIAERYPDRQCWPGDRKDRALARSVSNEMHSGFSLIRSTLPMNCRRKGTFGNISAELQDEINRVCAIWRFCRNRQHRGDFLFGQFTIADAMYAPMVLRFNSYGIAVGEVETRYMQALLDLPSLREWMNDAVAETEILQQYEV